MRILIAKIISLCIAVAIVIDLSVIKVNTRKRKKREAQRDDYLYAEDSDLPLSINWNEINEFLADSEYGVNMPMEQWFMLDWTKQPCVEDGIKEGKFSMKSFQVLQALGKDMKHIFRDVRFYYDRGPNIEDKNRKYEAVKKVLNTKYAGLSEEMSRNIYDQFVLVYEKRQSDKQ